MGVMTQATSDESYAEKAQGLLQQGSIAYNNWDLKRARLLWRKAAVTDPSNEAIWLALLEVLQDDEDRKVCLQNILILNPDNERAEKQLRLLENDTQPSEPQEVITELQPLSPVISDRISRGFAWLMTGLIILFVFIILLAMLIQPLT